MSLSAAIAIRKLPTSASEQAMTAVGARVFRTDKDGTVTVAFDAAGMTVRSEPRSRADTVAPAVAARAVPRSAGPRRIIGCAIPMSVPPSVPVRPIAWRRPPSTGRRPPSATIGTMPTGDPTAPPTIVPLLYVWGDDELAAQRLVERFASALDQQLGAPLERWDLRADLATAPIDAGLLYERLATPAMFGGGTLAVVSNPNALARRNDTRDRVLEAIGLLAAGNALALVEAAKSNAKGPSLRKFADFDRRGRRRHPRRAGTHGRLGSAPGSKARHATADCRWRRVRRASSPIDWERGSARATSIDGS